MNRILRQRNWIGVWLVLLAAGLTIILTVPIGPADADHSSFSEWPSAQQDCERWGSGWSNATQAEINAVEASDAEWNTETDWSPGCCVASSGNDIAWDQKPTGWSAPVCNPPTGLAKTCSKYTNSLHWVITETDIIIDDRTWTAAQLDGLMQSEWGHAGGLRHSSASCGLQDSTRPTMCATSTQTNLPWLSSFENDDISRMDLKY